MSTTSRPAWLLVLVVWLACLQTVVCKKEKELCIKYVNPDGETVCLLEDRKPSLYTGNYGDCLGNSLINVTRFDAAYYRDNSTITFHLAGDTHLTNESVVMYIGVYAYGSNRFDLLFNPCKAGITSLCPLNSSVPISAYGVTQISSAISDIPPLAFSIPDFEGQAILRIFANSTESEIACYSAVVTNGYSFAQPDTVGTVLGFFALVALLASFATAIYGAAIPTIRLHYAHSLSVAVVFEVYQHIFFTGALSVNWPSVLVAWWHNFAWSGGMIYTGGMQRSIDNLIGRNIGNTSEIGAAPSTSDDNVGGGYDISSIYKRAFRASPRLPSSHPLMRDLASEIYGQASHDVLLRRDLLSAGTAQHQITGLLQSRNASSNSTSHSASNSSSNASTIDSHSYNYYGHRIAAGMPLPGNYSGFAGTLAQENIPASNAFTTGLIWFLILLASVISAIFLLKFTLELLARLKRIEKDRLQFFRDRWIGYTILAALRTCLIAFFMIMFLTMFEFTYQSSAHVKILAGVVFAVFLLGLGGAAAYACYYKKRFVDHRDQRPMERKKLLGIFPRNARKTTTAETVDEHEPSQEPKYDGIRARPTSVLMDSIHDSEDYTAKFGWLASRFRRRRWWFFAVWLVYEFVRAAFYAGASASPLAQVFGLLVVEVVAFVFLIWCRPFEGRRLNDLVVYYLGFSKVTTVALSAAFVTTFDLPRITTTVIGLLIIIIQGVLTIITLIAVVVGAVSSYMSISRNREQFRPRKWHGRRERYFDHLDRAFQDVPREQKSKPINAKDQRPDPVAVMRDIHIRNMQRQANMVDENEEIASETRTQDLEKYFPSTDPTVAGTDGGFPEQKSGTASPVGPSRPGSIRSLKQSDMAYGAEPRPTSSSAKAFQGVVASGNRSGLQKSRSMESLTTATAVEENIPPTPTLSDNRFSDYARTSSLTNLRKSKVVPDLWISEEALRIGGKISTPDIIGDVPAPSVKSRPGSSRGPTRSMEDLTAPVRARSMESVPLAVRENIPPMPSAPERGWSTYSGSSSLKNIRKSKVVPDLWIKDEELRIGFGSSTRDKVGSVPAPTVRSRPDSSKPTRPGTARLASGGGSEGEEEASRSSSRRGSRYLPAMAIPMERDEMPVPSSSKQPQRETRPAEPPRGNDSKAPQQDTEGAELERAVRLEKQKLELLELKKQRLRAERELRLLEASHQDDDPASG